jgi:uncharacterized repeat protein (TIGR03803 family)
MRSYCVLAMILALSGCAGSSTSSSAPAGSAAMPAMRSIMHPHTTSYSKIYDFALNANTQSAILPSGSLNSVGLALSGTSLTAGDPGTGAVFTWTPSGGLSVNYRFQGGNDGAYPFYGVTSDQSGNLLGTTTQGGGTGCSDQGCGIVFEISGSTETVIHRFRGGADGADPESGLDIDSSGNLYGDTDGGGTGCSGIGGCGTVFKLTSSGSSYTQAVIYRFTGGADGSQPTGTPTVDGSGNIYGTTIAGGTTCDGSVQCGTVWKLTPSGASYTKSTIYTFQGGTADGELPAGGLYVTSTGVLYGATEAGGNQACTDPGEGNGCGTIFALTPSGGGYTESILHKFSAAPQSTAPLPSGVTLGSDGLLYGTTEFGGGCSQSDFPEGCGMLFSLSPSGGSYAVVHSFGTGNDGISPGGGLNQGSVFGVELRKRMRSVRTTLRRIVASVRKAHGKASAQALGLASPAVFEGALFGVTGLGGTGSCADFSGCGTLYQLVGP